MQSFNSNKRLRGHRDSTERPDRKSLIKECFDESTNKCRFSQNMSNVTIQTLYQSCRMPNNSGAWKLVLHYVSQSRPFHIDTGFCLYTLHLKQKVSLMHSSYTARISYAFTRFKCQRKKVMFLAFWNVQKQEITGLKCTYIRISQSATKRGKLVTPTM